MSRRSIVVLGLALGLSVVRAEAQGVAEPGYQVAFWYDPDLLAGPIRSQVYDVRKGEYDRDAVDRWLGVIKSQFPRHVAYVKGFPSESTPGKTGRDTLMAAIEREKARIKRQRQPVPVTRVVPPPGRQTPPRPMPDFRPWTPSIVSGRSPIRPLGPLSPGGPLGASSSFGPSTSSPFPYPYPRPHP